MNELELFAGAGGGILGSMLLGHRTVCAVECDAYARSVLLARQTDGTFPPFPVWDDVRTFDGRPWRGIAQVVSGGFPCQDISVAGKGAGLDGERSGLWSEMARIIGEVRPRYAFIENSPALIVRGLDRVLADLAALGFDARWGIMGAADVGAPHRRERVWILGYARSIGQPEGRDYYASDDRPEFGADGQYAGILADANSLRQLQPKGRQCEQRGRDCNCGKPAHVPDGDGDSVQGLEPESQSSGYGRPAGLHDRARGVQPWPADPADAPESGLGRVVDGLANRSNRIKAIGNGQVPRVRAAAWRILSGDNND